jgi:hypothetical protein
MKNYSNKKLTGRDNELREPATPPKKWKQSGHDRELREPDTPPEKWKQMRTPKAGGVLVVLCCGTKSVDKVWEQLGVPTISIDFDVKWKPDLLADISESDTDDLLAKIRKTIVQKFGTRMPILAFWASPECTQYSVANTTPRGGLRDLEKADALVKACLDIFDKHPFVPYFMENAATGLLKTRDVVQGLTYHTVTYCKYSAAEDPCCPEEACAFCEFRRKYLKPTAIWTNTKWVPKISQCKNGNRCPFVVDGKHPETVGGKNKGAKVFAIPGRLSREIAEYVLHSQSVNLE